MTSFYSHTSDSSIICIRQCITSVLHQATAEPCERQSSLASVSELLGRDFGRLRGAGARGTVATVEAVWRTPLNSRKSTIYDQDIVFICIYSPFNDFNGEPFGATWSFPTIL